MNAVTLQIEQRTQALEMARMAALTSSVAISHRYQVARVEAELKAIDLRKKQNYWRRFGKKTVAYAVVLVTGGAGGWMASNADLEGVLSAFSVNESAQQLSSVTAPVPVVAAPAPVIAHPSEPEASSWHISLDPGSTPVADDEQSLVVVDAVEVPFVRSLTRIGQTGLSSVQTFLKVNSKSERFEIVGLHAVGESDEVARGRSLTIAKVLQEQGVSSDRVTILAPKSTDEDSSILVGARLVSLGPAQRSLESITPGAPLGVIGSDFDPVFKGTPTPLANRSIEPLPRPETRPQKEAADDGVKELEAAVSAAAQRRLEGSAPPPSPAKQQNRDQGGGVFIKVPTPPSAPQADRSAPASSRAAPKAPSPQPSYTIISKMETAVLVKMGNQVRHVKVGDVLPDGKVLGPDLKPVP